MDCSARGSVFSGFGACGASSAFFPGSPTPPSFARSLEHSLVLLPLENVGSQCSPKQEALASAQVASAWRRWEVSFLYSSRSWDNVWHREDSQ